MQGARAWPDKPDTVIFVLHGPFDSNSGGHVCHFANGLVGAGIDVAVIGRSDPAEAAVFGPPLFETLTYKQAARHGWAARRGRRCLIHAWTPRERVVEIVDGIRRSLPCPYVVHLEDHEIHVTEAFSQTSWPELERMGEREAAARIPQAFSRPATARRFMREAAGVSVIVDRLSELVPSGKPIHLLEPGIEGDRFTPDLDPAKADALRRELGIAPSTWLVAYHGNSHITNRREIFSLYTSILILRRRGHDIRLLRCGKDDGEPLDVSFPAIAEDVALPLGFQPRDRLIDLLRLADIFVQPGRPDRFNDYRLPSKLPEFLALGRPVILPRTNLGLRLRHGEEAWVLDRCDGESIASAVETLLADSGLRSLLGRNGRRFALDHLDWQKNVDGLLPFYAGLLADAAHLAA